MVDLERRPERQVKNTNTNRFQRIRENAIATAAKALAPKYDRDTGYQANSNPARRPNPIVIEGVLQKIRNADENGGNSNAVQPVRSDPGLEISMLSRNRRGCEIGRGWND